AATSQGLLVPLGVCASAASGAARRPPARVPRNVRRLIPDPPRVESTLGRYSTGPERKNPSGWPLEDGPGHSADGRLVQLVSGRPVAGRRVDAVWTPIVGIRVEAGPMEVLAVELMAMKLVPAVKLMTTVKTATTMESPVLTTTSGQRGGGYRCHCQD